MCVLLVEDEDIIRMILVDAMADAGFEVIEAVDVEAALALAETTPCPELIVSDINLGAGMDGFATVAVSVADGAEADDERPWGQLCRPAAQANSSSRSRLSSTHSCITSSTWQGAPAALCQPEPLSGPV